MNDMGNTATKSEVRTMKAVFQDSYGATEVLRFGDIEKPEIGDDEVLVRVRAAGVDRGVWHLMTGLAYPVRLVSGLRKPKNPILGSDVAGIVETVGKNVTRFAPGDEVMGIGKGTFAEYARALEKKLVAKPANLTFEQAAVASISGITALQAVQDAKVQPGQSVLIIGAAGGVGTYAVQIAKAFGAEVTAVVSTTKMDLVRAIGADHVIDYTREDFVDGARRWDVILDIAGNRPLRQLRRALTSKGTLVIIGGEEGGKWLGGLGRPIGASLLSIFASQRLRMLFSKERLEYIQTVKELAEAGKITPVIEKTYSLREVPEAIRHLEAGRARGKLVITL